MKEKDAVVPENERVIVVYVEKDDATYGPARSGTLLAPFMDDLQPRLDRFRDHFLGRLKAGEISPIGYYLGVLEMTEVDLAERMGLRLRRVRRHLTPEGFGEVRGELLTRYARLFGIAPDELLRVPLPEGGAFTPPGAG